MLVKSSEKILMNKIFLSCIFDYFTGKDVIC